MSTIDEIIDSLGYTKSDFLYYTNELDKIPHKLSLQSIRMLEELNPYAFFCTDKQPLVLFFNAPENNKHFKKIHQKIWNSQTAVAIFNYENHIKIYNGFSLDSETKTLPLLKTLFSNNIDYFSDFSYWNISDNLFWESYKEYFKHPTIDTYLLNNIKYIIDNFQVKSCAPISVKLTLRFIFIRFLIDRAVDVDFPGFSGSPVLSQQKLLSLTKSKDDLYDFFEHLKYKFNGNLFEFYENSKSKEMELIDDDDLKILYDFLAGHQLSSGQLSLFPLYDFNIIPVELISNIYEQLLGSQKQKDDSAFYTPPFLVDYILKQTVKPHLEKYSKCTVLDPACGSGIFLVEILRSIIERNLHEGKFFQNNEMLISLLTENIFGIDKNSEAIDVAIFSLYLVLIDYKDPKCLRDFKLPDLKSRNFTVCDFFDNDYIGHLRKMDFEFIIGNPPWGNVSNSSHVQYCIENNVPNPRNEISRSFIARTKDFSNNETICCMIVTSKIFYNKQPKAKAFRKWLLTGANINQFIELAAVRNQLFKKAKGPAAVITYNFSDVETENHNITHLTLKPNNFFEILNLIVIESYDIKYIPQSLLLEDDWAWKTIVFGTTSDYYAIKKLFSDNSTIMDLINENHLNKGQGLQVKGEDKQKNSAEHLIGKKLINAKSGISPFYVNIDESILFNEKTAHRPRPKHLFDPPFVLIKKGVDTKTYKLRAAYSDEELIYADSVYGIAGNRSKDHENLLLSLTGVINSSFYAYLNLMLGSSTGIEREQSFPTHVLDYPSFTDEKLASLVYEIQKINKEPFKRNELNNLIEEMDNYISSYFKMENNEFFDYALNIQIPRLTGDNSVFKKVTSEDMLVYAEGVINYWQELLSDQYIQIIIYPAIINSFSAMEVFFLDEQPVSRIIVDNNSNESIELISRFALTKHNDLFYQIKDIIQFGDNSFAIIKPNEYKNWHPSLRHVDMSNVINSIFLQEERDIK